MTRPGPAPDPDAAAGPGAQPAPDAGPDPRPDPRPGSSADHGRIAAVVAAAAPWAMAVLGTLLAWYSQISLRLTGPGRLAVAAIAALVALLTALSLAMLVRRGGPRSGPRPRWRSPALLAWVAAWLGIATSAALTWRGLPVGEKPALGEIRAIVSAREELTLLAGGALAGTALLVLSRGSRRGIVGFRLLWLAVLLTTAPVALWEVGTDQHIVLSRWGEGVWNFTAHVPAATFANPNNYGCVLVAVVGSLLAWSLDRVPPWIRVLLLGLAVFASALIWATLSRGAFAAVAGQLVVAALGLAARLNLPARVRSSRPTRVGVALTGTALALGVLASFVVPSLAARNPLLRAPKAGETESDDLRLNLVRAALRYWRDSPWVGTGPGTYEYHLTREQPPGIPDPTINAHNAFVEILSQYGLLGAVPVAVLLGLLGWYVVRPRPAGAPDQVALRVELACLLVAAVVTGLVVSSALALPLWFVMLAHATALAWAAEPDPLTG